MREHIISELAKELLGPSGGPNEILDGDGPRQRYVTGILAPTKTSADPSMQPPTAPPTESNEDAEIRIDGELSPPLNPKDIPSTMGISFLLRSDEPEFSVCVTWARYAHSSVSGVDRWQRNPRTPFIIKIRRQETTPIFINGSGQRVQNQDEAELALYHTIQSPDAEGRIAVDIRLKNVITFQQGEDNIQRFYVFQPELRVVCEDGTKIAHGFDPKFTDNSQYQSEIKEKRLFEILFRKRKVYAKGHLVSAVWNEPGGIKSVTDAQVDKPDTSKLDVPASVNEIPFVWTDGGGVSDDRFRRADVRSEFLPMYSIPKPETFWNDINQKTDGEKYCADAPELKAAELAEAWNPADIKKKLMPLHDGYNEWIKHVKKILLAECPDDTEIIDDILEKCTNVCGKIKDGIDLLSSDEKARLAFCFANKAVDMQYGWNNKDGQGSPKQFVYYPFQLAFILATIESISNSDSAERDVCDLLWVPTGGGKTEAYLVLTAFLLGYRRRRSLEKVPMQTGDGVAVLTRYTLRLLSVQQFRRMLSIIMSCEKMRVERSGTQIGWRPAQSQITGNIIWGSVPFSLGLWLGAAMTPNHLESNDFFRSYQALENLRDLQETSEGGDPCQVTNCPACDEILSIPVSAENSGLEPRKQKRIFLTLHANGADAAAIRNSLNNRSTIFDITVNGDTVAGAEYVVFDLQVTALGAPRSAKDFHNEIVSRISNAFPGSSSQDARARIASTRADKPGYFFRTRRVSPGGGRPSRLEPYDFEIICPNPECPLATEWFSGAPYGCVNGRDASPSNLTNSDSGITLNDGNNLVDVQESFASSQHVSQRITIGAYTVDEQIYAKTPSVVIATVDKFARPPYNANAGTIFGNVTGHHAVSGYYRIDAEKGKHPDPTGTSRARNYRSVESLDPPELIIQDELHLIEGPVGSMVGLYETAFDYLCQRGDTKPKYIASTATVRRAEEQVQCTFDRRLSMFPPHGESYGNRFFVIEREAHVFDSKNPDGSDKPGKLYMGILAPGKGAHTPAIRMWARNAQTVYEQRNTLPENVINKFWTQTGYFNATKELSSFSATYSQDIAQRMTQIGGASPRPLDQDNKLEMSARGGGMQSSSLPNMLDKLSIPYVAPDNAGDSPDSLIGTAMIGTGIDVPRINLMTVFGQPKSMSQYIQATGRSGRTDASVIVTFYQAAKPRDLSHYELFMGNHRQMQRFVEAPTVYPFSIKNMGDNIGPVIVYILRNKIRNATQQTSWGLNDSAVEMRNYQQHQEVRDVLNIIERRAQRQHDTRKPKKQSENFDKSAFGIATSKIQNWSRVAQRCHNDNQPLEYVQYNIENPHSVVLGDVKHQEKAQTGDIHVVFRNAQQSLRDVEEMTHVDSGEIIVNGRTDESAHGVRTSQFVIGMGPGYILQPKEGVSRIVPSARIGLFTDVFLRSHYPEALENTFRIHDRKIDAALAGLQNIPQAALYRIPTNSQLITLNQINPVTNRNREEEDAVYQTNPFPNYYVCTNRTGHNANIGGSSQDYDILFENTRMDDHPHCPICQGIQSEAVSSTRFLVSCPEGHMDDINWPYHIHHSNRNQNGTCNVPTPAPVVDPRVSRNDIFAIRFDPPNRSGLDFMILQCPRCNETKAMSEIYSSERHYCTARFPEEEGLVGSGRRAPPTGAGLCTKTQPSMQVIQKSASFLRSVDPVTMLSVGEDTTQIDDLFQRDARIGRACDDYEFNMGGTPRPIVAGNLEEFLRGMLGPRPSQPSFTPLLNDDQITNLLGNQAETLRAISDRNNSLPADFDELLLYEFHELLKGSVGGVPAAGGVIGRTRFHMNDDNFNKNITKYKINGVKKHLWVASVDDLTTVTIQTSYKRDKSENRQNVQHPDEHDIGFEHNNERWYPAVEFQGEGIFVRFKEPGEDENSDLENLSWTQPLQGTRAERWRNEALANGQNYDRFSFRNKKQDTDVNPPRKLSRMYELDPDFIWWHTFAHALVKTIQDSAGYSNTAIHERVYFERNDDGRVRGGILLYVSQPGVDGTLGGLVGLIPEFSRYVDGAIDMMQTCSGDPMCRHASLEPTSTPYTGCACFACVMNSETSCDIRNFYLDREVFRENALE